MLLKKLAHCQWTKIKVEKLYDGLLQQACSHSQPAKSPLNIRQNLSRNRESAFRVISPNKNLPLKSFDDYAAKNGVTSQHAHHHDLAVLRFLAGEQPQKTFEEGTSAIQQEVSQRNFAKNLADLDNSC